MASSVCTRRSLPQTGSYPTEGRTRRAANTQLLKTPIHEHNSTFGNGERCEQPSIVLGTLDGMPFDPASFEAEVALKLIPTERLPVVAQDALEAGFEGPYVLRMAILERFSGWAIDQALLPMLAELGCQTIAPKEAALRLAHIRAQRILQTGEDPLSSILYFYQLMLAAHYPDELIELGYFDDDDIFFSDDLEVRRVRAREALEDLLSPDLRQKRLVERKVAWELEEARVKSEWPYVLNSPTGRVLLKNRYREKITECARSSG